ncbi:hypothetical protein V5799_016753 [Amblyomma americanum]|uniref:Uncharacterized protein n=1 Tax=Amblyomma americanum TaxID=6943 RepID=A0AAQ4F493_AMBAM
MDSASSSVQGCIKVVFWPQSPVVCCTIWLHPHTRTRSVPMIESATPGAQGEHMDRQPEVDDITVSSSSKHLLILIL